MTCAYGCYDVRWCAQWAKHMKHMHTLAVYVPEAHSCHDHYFPSWDHCLECARQCHPALRWVVQIMAAELTVMVFNGILSIEIIGWPYKYSLLLFSKQNLLTYAYTLFALPMLKCLQNKPQPDLPPQQNASQPPAMSVQIWKWKATKWLSVLGHCDSQEVIPEDLLWLEPALAHLHLHCQSQALMSKPGSHLKPMSYSLPTSATVHQVSCK